MYVYVTFDQSNYIGNGLINHLMTGGLHIAVLEKSQGHADMTAPLNYWAPDAQC